MTYFRSPWNDLFGWRPDYYAAYRRDELSTQTCEEVTSFAGEAFHCLLCSLVTQLPLAENTGLCSILSTCLKFLETDSLKRTENWNLSLTFKGPKSIQSKWLNLLFMLLNSQNRRYSGLSVPSGPCTHGGAGGRTGDSHLTFLHKKMMKSYWDALKTNINTCRSILCRRAEIRLWW